MNKSKPLWSVMMDDGAPTHMERRKLVEITPQNYGESCMRERERVKERERERERKREKERGFLFLSIQALFTHRHLS